MAALHFDMELDNRPLIRPFSIATGVRTHQPVLTVRLSQGDHVGVGQATGVSYLKDTPPQMKDQIAAVARQIEAGVDRSALQKILPAGGARAALDAALWDLDAKRTGVSVADQIGVKSGALESVFTIGLDTPEAMAERTHIESWRPILKVKLGGSPDQEAARIRAVADAAGSTRLVTDANAAWTPDQLIELAPIAADAGFELIEQPLPAGAEQAPDARAALLAASQSVPLCVDESFQSLDDFDAVADLYQFINIKLDKCGGLTEGLKIRDRARAKGLGIFVGCMISPTIAIAPAFLLAQGADYVDLDGPFWLHDEPVELTSDGLFAPISPQVWGGSHA
ncbi:MAG: dipeptide epimerase [Pseudomonadota bacterium]